MRSPRLSAGPCASTAPDHHVPLSLCRCHQPDRRSSSTGGVALAARSNRSPTRPIPQSSHPKVLARALQPRTRPHSAQPPPSRTAGRALTTCHQMQRRDRSAVCGHVIGKTRCAHIGYLFHCASRRYGGTHGRWRAAVAVAVALIYECHHMGRPLALEALIESLSCDNSQRPSRNNRCPPCRDNNHPYTDVVASEGNKMSTGEPLPC